MATSKAFVVTGASRGIGFELVRQLLGQGHRVIAGVRAPEKAKELQALARDSGDRLRVLSIDVSSDESVANFARDIGAVSIDVLINNAGVYSDDDDRVSEIEPRVVEMTFSTNTLGPLRVTQALLPALRRSSEPKVANITSQMGSIADNGSGSSVAYRMSKAALNMLTKCLAVEEPSLIVLSLHPGWVKTSMGGVGAPLETSRSVEGLLKVIDDAGKSASGRFLTYAGKELPY